MPDARREGMTAEDALAYVLNLRRPMLPVGDRTHEQALAHVKATYAALAEKTAECERQTEFGAAERTKFLKAYDEARLLRAQLDAAREEIEYLRRYGNRDCTAMADEALDTARSTDAERTHGETR